MIRSLRARLTLWYLAFFSLLFLLFSLFLHSVLSRALERRFVESLSVEANTAAAILMDEFEEEKGDALIASREALANLRMSDSTVAFLVGGRVLGSSAPIPAEEFKEIARLAASDGASPQLVALPQAGPNGTRAAVVRISLGGEPYLVMAVRPLDSVADDLGVVRHVLLLALPLVIALAGIGGYLLTRRSLAPLASMARQANHITQSNLDTRLEVGSTAEELAVLAASFNELLARLDLSFDHMRRFVADASHELRTPISIIRGEADVAL